MANSKKIHIRTLTVERYSIRTGQTGVMFCLKCGQLVEMLTIEQASSLNGISMRMLFQYSENGWIHSEETDSGQLMFCRESLDVISADEFEGSAAITVGRTIL